MANDVIILNDNIRFSSEELNMNEVGSLPIYIASVSSLQVLDSYLQTPEGEKKLYRPSPPNTPVTWGLNLNLNNNKIKLIYELVLEQMAITRDFRRGFDTKALNGFSFSVDYNNLSLNGLRVWISNFSTTSPFLKINKTAAMSNAEEVFSTKLEVVEIE